MGPCSISWTCLQSRKLHKVLFSEAFLLFEFNQSREWGSVQVAMVIWECIGCNVSHHSLPARLQWRKTSHHNLPPVAPNSVDLVNSCTRLVSESILCHCLDVSGTVTLLIVRGSTSAWARTTNGVFLQGRWNEGPQGLYHRECYKVYTRPNPSMSNVCAQQELTGSVAAWASLSSSIIVAAEG